MFRISSFIAVSVLTLLTACTQQSDHANSSSKILAKVNGEPVTEYELMASIESLFGRSANRLKKSEQNKILESIIMSRLIRQQAEKIMDKSDRTLFEQKSRIYKEKIIVNDFLKKNIKSAPVTNEMVTEYYNKHPEKFGGGNILYYELLTTENKMNENDRDKLLSIYIALNKTADMKKLKNSIGKKGIKLNYQKGKLRPGVFDAKLENILANLEQGETSTLSMQKGRPYIIKLVERKQQPAKPLLAVSADIRKQLAPVALKKAIKQKTDKLKESAEIEYFFKH